MHLQFDCAGATCPCVRFQLNIACVYIEFISTPQQGFTCSVDYGLKTVFALAADKGCELSGLRPYRHNWFGGRVCWQLGGA